ncbi:MAG TPA: 50S ribosomal protein L1 [Planctomycetaceae bacterium]|jgi:large subunit ribosomal protein L1|nr:50S ribosomal protein L1 [Planctomycetaceae bacterium]HCP10877.1 50S ribosomal protein L1 [Planctomycetaceae bacterium]
MAGPSKRMKILTKKAADIGALSVADAVKALKSLDDSLPKNVKKVRFDQTVEIAVRLGVDPRQADQIVRGSLVLPHGIGKSQRVLVFAQGENVAVAQAAGADFVGGKELADKIKEGWLDFDVCIATPDMMGVVGPLGRVLGPRGLMPSPRAGTVTQDVAGTVREYKAGKVEFRVDNGSNVHCVVGKLSFDAQLLAENIESLLAYIRSLKPNTSRGVYLRGMVVSATMMPAISVAV